MPRLPSFPTSLFLAALFIARPSFAQDPDGGERDETNIPSSDRVYRPVHPSGRTHNYSILLAGEYQGGWMAYHGDLHAHSRGHNSTNQQGSSLPTPIISRAETNNAAYYFGYDFFAITNHTTSWKTWDENAPLHTEVYDLGSSNPVQVLLNGRENYYGEAHFNVYNKLYPFDSSDKNDWYLQILSNYNPDPQQSVHVQLNHPYTADPIFTFPPPPAWNYSPIAVNKIRDAIETAELNDSDFWTYLEMLRRGFRVSPTFDSDTHAIFREQAWRQGDGGLMDKNPNGSWAHPYIDDPGVPKEFWKGWDTSDLRRTGIVLPASMPLTYANLLTALRSRWTFASFVPGAAGFFTVNQLPMGSEFSIPEDYTRTATKLDFTVWANTKNATAGNNQWVSLEVYSPFTNLQSPIPGEFAPTVTPIKTISYNDINLLNLKQTFSLTPYESVYVIKLTQAYFEPRSSRTLTRDLILAPIWITNPIPKPQVSFSQGAYNRSDFVCLRVEGGGNSVTVQEAAFSSIFVGNRIPAGWKDITTLSRGPSPGCSSISTTNLGKYTKWRVIDSLQREEVRTNPVELVIQDALDVSTAYTFDIDEGHSIGINWTSDNPEQVAYYASSDGGATWSEVARETQAYSKQTWSFPMAGWGNKDVMIKVASSTHSGLYGVTPSFHVAILPGGFFRPAGQANIYNSNGVGHVCRFPSWNSFLMSGGNSDSSNVTIISSLPSTVINDGDCATGTLPASVPVYRFRDTQTGDYLLTLSHSEVTGPRWVEEPSSSFYIFSMQVPNTAPLYRCRTSDSGGGRHFASRDGGCEGQLKEGLYGDVYMVQVDGTRPLYRNYSPSAGNYLITWSASEGPNAGYQSQGILGYIPN